MLGVQGEQGTPMIDGDEPATATVVNGWRHEDTVEDLAEADLQRRVLDLRLRGESFEAIATAIGYRTRSGALRVYRRAIASRGPEPGEVQRAVQLELERLDALQRRLWDDAMSEDQDVSLPAVDRILKIIALRAKFLGLDTARVQVLIAQHFGVPREDESRVVDADAERRAKLLALLGR